jgi:spore photoproduct lyase
MDLDHGGRTVISFSVNAEAVCSALEPRAASLRARLLAAQRAVNRGYQVGLHFDPLIYFPGWEKGYLRTTELIAQCLDPKFIAFISLGCFRYLPELKPVMLKNRPSALFEAEFIRGGDGKMRYPRPRRRLIYKTVLGFLQQFTSPLTIIYLCMESGQVWREVFGFDPGTLGLTKMFRSTV